MTTIPSVSDSAFEKAAELFQQGQYSKVIDNLNASDLDPSLNPSVSLILAASYFYTQDFTASLIWCESAFESESSNPNFLSLYAAALRRNGDFTKSEEIFKFALDQFSGDRNILNNYSNLLVDTGRYNEAIAILKELVAAHPDYQDAVNNLKRLESLNAQELETNGVQIASTFQSNPLLAAFDEIEVLHSKNQESKSRLKGNNKITDSITDSLPQPPFSQTIQELLSLARRLSSEKPDLSIKLLNSVIVERGLIPESYSIAGSAYISLKLFQDAELSYLTSLSLGCKSSEHYVNLANLACLRGDKTLSKYWLSRLQSDFPNTVSTSMIDSINESIERMVETPFQINLEQQVDLVKSENKTSL